MKNEQNIKSPKNESLRNPGNENIANCEKNIIFALGLVVCANTSYLCDNKL